MKDMQLLRSETFSLNRAFQDTRGVFISSLNELNTVGMHCVFKKCFRGALFVLEMLSMRYAVRE